MALSGTVNTTSFEGRYLSLTWTAKQDIATNKSTISWTLKGAGGNTSIWYQAAPFKVTIGGTVVYNNSNIIQLYNGTKVASGSINISHGADGKKSFTISVEGAIYYASINCTGSKSFTLDTIPRAAKVSTAKNFNDEGNPKITYKNYAGSSVTTLQACISFDGSSADVAYRDISKTGTSYTFNLTDAERKVLRQGTKSNSRTVYFCIKTVVDGNTFYSKLSKTLTLVNHTPTLSPTAEVSTESTTYSLTGSTTKFIKGVTNVSVSTGATARKEATIKSQTVTCGNDKITGASGKINAVESATFKFSVSDSRGNTTTKTLTRTLVDYIKLTCNLNVQMTVDGTLTIKMSGKYFNGSFGAVNNTLTVQYRYKEYGSTYTSWTSVNPTISSNSYSASKKITGLDYQKKYVVEIRATDKLYTITPPTKTVKALPVFDWGEKDFNFNVPVNVDTLTSGDGSVSVKKLVGMANLLSNNYSLDVTATASGNWSGLSCACVISGGVFRLNISEVKRSSAISGNITNEKIGRVTIKHDGKVKTFYNATFVSNGEAALSGMYTANITNGDKELSFDIYVSATAGSTSVLAGVLIAPVSFNLEKFV